MTAASFLHCYFMCTQRKTEMYSFNVVKSKRKRILTIKALISISASRVCIIYEDTFNRKELVQY